MKNKSFGLLAFLLSLALVACSSSSGNGDGGNGGDQDGINNDDPNGGDPNGGDPAGGDHIVGPGDIPICDTFEIQAGAIPPNLLLVVDMSGSMRDRTSTNSTRTKWQDAKDALNMMVNDGEGKIRFGWMQFPSDDHCAPGVVTVRFEDQNAISQVRAAINAISSTTIGGGTPTGESLQNANAYQGLHDEERNNFVVLLTDGIPTCPNANGYMPPNSTQAQLDADAALALQAVQTLRGSGIDTFVIGLGEDLNNTNPQLLNQMAEAGGRPRQGADKYYKANSLEDLQQALQDISGMVIGCNLSLDSYPEYPDWLWVFFCDQNKQNCVAQTRDRNEINGWNYDEKLNQIVFYGPLCDQLRSGQVPSVLVLMGCGPPT